MQGDPEMNRAMTTDLNECRERCEAYLGRTLEASVSLVRTERLAKSTREAPWRLDVKVSGVPRSYVLRLDSRGIEHEFQVLRAMESIAIPTPRVYGWDPEGRALGVPCFFSDFVVGESLLGPVVAGEAWAEELYIDTVAALQGITEEQLAGVVHRLDRVTAADVLEHSNLYFHSHPQPLADSVYRELKERTPELPDGRFSNGDLWLDNVIVRDGHLAGVIDFTNAGFSDPIYEFLLSFFVCPELQCRGIEERYCRRMGFDPGTLPWYHGLEFFEMWSWVLSAGEPFVHHTADSLRSDLEKWLDQAYCR